MAQIYSTVNWWFHQVIHEFSLKIKGISTPSLNLCARDSHKTRRVVKYLCFCCVLQTKEVLLHDKKSFWCCFFLHFASELGISYFSLLTGCMKTEQNRTWRLSSQTWCALFLYKMYIEAEHCVQNNINTSSTKLVFNFFMFFYKTQVISRKVGENVFSIWLLMIDVGIGCKYLYKLIVHVWLNQKLISPPRKHNYCINVEEWGDRKSTSVNSHHRESLYLTWEFYGNTTIMLSNEPLQGQLNSLHTPGIVYRQLCLYM